ncbi:hypothetical protein [Flavobacterium sp. NRK F7]|uniref:hypothetical protein n=1 Tax=Flavobacterium sp. NRK F7 TaxID=2954930 RepID=UPI00209032C2|nr:hypothetical protein [Flavobacterium sp. NRK F7]MCO6164477.1 hypothetical protein [Flavobacterium sp. NRK F7]
MRTLYKILGLAFIDFGLIWLWVYQMDPDPSFSIGIILLVPFVFVLNLIIAGVLFYAKKKEYARVFLINSATASIIMFYLFGKGIDRHQNRRLEQWTFQKADTTFSLIRWKETNEFSMTYSLNPGSSWGFLDGHCVNENGIWILKADSLTMKIDNEDLIGFRNATDTIKMKKVER